jgi:hypothetical protein
MAENVTAKDLDNLKIRKLPFFIVGKTDLEEGTFSRPPEEEKILMQTEAALCRQICHSK